MTLEGKTAHHDDWTAVIIVSWGEALRLLVEEYGDCTVRTNTDLLPNDTALMLKAMAEFKCVDEKQYEDMIGMLVRSGGFVCAHDRRKMNCFIHATGSTNQVSVLRMVLRPGAMAPHPAWLRLQSAERGRPQCPKLGESERRLRIVLQ